MTQEADGELQKDLPKRDNFFKLIKCLYLFHARCFMGSVVQV